MSVLKNKRRTSEIEYEYNYAHRIYKDIKGRMSRIPKRYYEEIRSPIMETCNEIYNDILNVSQLYTDEKKSKSSERFALCERILDEFENLIKYLYLYWNLSSSTNTSMKPVSAKSRKYLCKMINREISLIKGVAKYINADRSKKLKETTMTVYTYNQIKDVTFLKNLYHLQRNIIKLRKTLPLHERDCEILIAKKIAVDAFYNAFTANNIFPTNKSQYTRRKNLFRESISALYKINRPLGEVFMQGFGTNLAKENISKNIDEALKMIQTIQKTDAERFSEL